MTRYNPWATLEQSFSSIKPLDLEHRLTQLPLPLRKLQFQIDIALGVLPIDRGEGQVFKVQVSLKSPNRIPLELITTYLFSKDRQKPNFNMLAPNQAMPAVSKVGSDP